jgi:hypothetical protein
MHFVQLISESSWTNNFELFCYEGIPALHSSQLHHNFSEFPDFLHVRKCQEIRRNYDAVVMNEALDFLPSFLV